jgi:hypothetical protein
VSSIPTIAAEPNVGLAPLRASARWFALRWCSPEGERGADMKVSTIAVAALAALWSSPAVAEPDLTIRTFDVRAAPAGAVFSLTLDAPFRLAVVPDEPEGVYLLDPMRDVFQVQIYPNPPSWNPPQGSVVIRGSEIACAGGIAVRDVDGWNGAPDCSGGWGPVRGVVPCRIEGASVRFTVPWAVLGDTDRAFGWRVYVVRDGSITDERHGYCFGGPTFTAARPPTWGSLKTLYLR